MGRLERWAVWSTSFLTVATGVGYFVTKYLLAAPAGYAAVNHPWQPFFLKAHILVSPLLLFALGLVAAEHVWKHYRERVRLSRRTALVTMASVVPMVLTGYLIQVLTGEGWVRSMAVAHIGFGLLYAVALVVHVWIVRTSDQEAGNGSPSREERTPGRARGGAERVDGREPRGTARSTRGEDERADGAGESGPAPTPGASRTDRAGVG